MLLLARPTLDLLCKSCTQSLYLIARFHCVSRAITCLELRHRMGAHEPRKRRLMRERRNPSTTDCVPAGACAWGPRRRQRRPKAEIFLTTDKGAPDDSINQVTSRHQDGLRRCCSTARINIRHHHVIKSIFPLNQSYHLSQYFSFNLKYSIYKTTTNYTLSITYIP